MLLKIYPCKPRHEVQHHAGCPTLSVSVSVPYCLSLSLVSTSFRTLSLNWVFWGACRERVFWAMRSSTPTSTVVPLLLLSPRHTDLAGPLLYSCLIEWPSPNLCLKVTLSLRCSFCLCFFGLGLLRPSCHGPVTLPEKSSHDLEM